MKNARGIGVCVTVRRSIVLNDFYEFRFEPVVIPPPKLVNDLRKLIDNEELSDVTFLVEGRPVYACRAHLAVRKRAPARASWGRCTTR